MFRFCNQYGKTLWVAFQWSSPGCPDGGDWETAGWWKLDPGQCKVVFGRDLQEVNTYYYFYAEAIDGAVWGGPFMTCVPQTVFDWCLNTCSTAARYVGFRELNIDGYNNYTFNLTP